MAKYRLTYKAVEDLSSIWDYTYVVWSEKQADKYYYELIDTCAAIAENQTMGKHYNEINREIMCYPSGLHLIFYRVINNREIEITRILHSRMDLKKRIQE